MRASSTCLKKKFVLLLGVGLISKEIPLLMYYSYQALTFNKEAIVETQGKPFCCGIYILSSQIYLLGGVFSLSKIDSNL